MSDKHSTLLKELLLLVLGALLAITGGSITSYLNHKWDTEKIDQQRSHDRLSFIIALQSEIESNLLLMKRDFMSYRKQLSDGVPFTINRPVFTTTVFDSHVSRIGEIHEPEIISEIVAFYSSLNYFETWCEGTKGLIAEVGNPNGYVRSHANILHAGIYLQKRLDKITGTYRKENLIPTFSDDQKMLLREIETLRKKLGATKSDMQLKFHKE
ncbi:hypothetical protein [Desulfatitalea tepidiphila]|uniref:hypothetical protein n=1 Tax=Desulfatitalea tepidiphila TaxID=1185843 RepID=UPI0006B5AECF|nr:hypothetical protein [Desulfatitalea tepidiphila]